MPSVLHMPDLATKTNNVCVIAQIAHGLSMCYSSD